MACWISKVTHVNDSRHTLECHTYEQDSVEKYVLIQYYTYHLGDNVLDVGCHT